MINACKRTASRSTIHRNGAESNQLRGKGKHMSGTMRGTLQAVGIVVLLAFTVQMARAQAAGKKAVDAFKNIQVLKDMPAEQLGPTMQFFASSLGVECEFCHDRERDKDVKEQKQTARKMLKMVMA